MARRASVWRGARTMWGICSVAVVGLAGEVAFAHPPGQPAGSLDVGFGNGGIVLTPANITSNGDSVLALDDGRIVAGAATLVDNSDGFTLFRYRPDGTLDPAFGINGTVHTPFSSVSTLAGMILQPDSKIVAVGTLANADLSETIVLTRYRHDGQLDQNFGTNGQVFTSLGTGTIARAGGLALQPDGRIVVVGLSVANDASPPSLNLLVRYNRDGSLDGTFGVGGLVSIAFNNSFAQILNAVAIADDGKIVVVGNCKQSPIGFNGALARFNNDGSIDTTFGNGGVVLQTFGGQTFFGSLVLQHDGRILVGGGSVADDGLVARFEPDGTFDATFGAGGLVFASSLAQVAIKLDRCDRIVGAGGPSGTGGGIGLIRLERDGSADPTFGTAGMVTTPVDGMATNVDGLALAGDDVVVVGDTSPVNTNVFSPSLLVARYEAGDERRCECGRGAHGF